MITASVAYADLRQRSRQALGRERLRRDFDVATLIKVHEAAFTAVSSTAYSADIPEVDFRQAMVGDLEAVFDRCVAQCLAYGYLLDSEVDPIWTAVTGYYAAFFGVRLLHAAIGTGTRNVAGVGSIKPALYRYSATASVFPNRVVLTLRRVTAGSHIDVWRRYVSDLQALSSLRGLDVRSQNVLAGVVPIVSQPRLPSDFRNRVNYGLESAWARPKWSTHLRDVASATELERLILSTGTAPDEQRVEIALLTAVSFGTSLYRDYLRNADRPDRRRAEARVSLLTRALGGSVGDGLRGIFQAV